MMAQVHYSDTEKQDAIRVDEAIAMISRGEITEACSTLQQIVANTPQLYVYNFGNEKELFIKFWTMAEYLGYIALTRNRGEEITQEVIWLKSAYPRAYYHLAELDLANNNDGGAAEYLDMGLALEPDHPDMLLRMAEIYARNGDVPRALEHFDLAMNSRPYIATKTICHALGGKAQMLVEADRLAEAEACLEESLKHNPKHELTANLKRYVAAMKAGTVQPPVQVEGVLSDESDTDAAPARTAMPAAP